MTDFAYSSSPLQVLLVDDSPVNRKLMGGMLTQLGCTVTIAKNGREAVTIFAAHRFDVVLMDVQMPIMDGISATRLIRQHEFAGGNRTPIIAVTAGVDRGSCLDAGMDEHLLKPVRMKTLEAALMHAVVPKV